MHHRLHRAEHVLLGGEAHFQVELIEFARGAVGAGVLVAKTGRDLEVAVEAGDHQQLLELLGRLRQGVELARMDAGRHQIVPGAFRRRGGENRGLELGEAGADHPPTDRIDHLRAQHDVAVQAFATQVEVTVFQPDLFGVVRLAEHRQRQLGGRRQGLDGAYPHLDLAGGQVRVDGVGAAGDYLAVDPHHAFGAQALQGLETGGGRAGHELGQAMMVAQVDEQQAAVVAFAVNPAGEPHIRPLVREPQGAAGVGAIGVHNQVSRGLLPERRGRAHEPRPMSRRGGPPARPQRCRVSTGSAHQLSPRPSM